MSDEFVKEPRRDFHANGAAMWGEFRAAILAAAITAMAVSDCAKNEPNGGCTKDSDCKGDRICVAGGCRNPDPIPSSSGAPASAGVSSVAVPQTSAPARSGTIAEPSASARVPSFSGRIGQLAKSNKFAKFIYEHRFKVVLLDVTIPLDEFDGDQKSFLVLWERCDSLPVGEKPSSAHCVGTEYNIKKDASAEGDLFCTRGICKLSGYFAVSDFGGPNQGLMGTTLRSVRVENIGR